MGSLSQKELSIDLVPYSKGQGKVEQVRSQMLRHVRAKRLSEHAQGSNAAIHPWLPELLAQVCAKEWHGPLDHGLPAGCLNRSKGGALDLRFAGISHSDMLSPSL